MRIARKKRQRQRYAMEAKELRNKISEQESQLRDSEKKGITDAWQKTYWEQWHYELDERKKDVAKESLDSK